MGREGEIGPAGRPAVAVQGLISLTSPCTAPPNGRRLLALVPPGV